MRLAETFRKIVEERGLTVDQAAVLLREDPAIVRSTLSYDPDDNSFYSGNLLKRWIRRLQQKTGGAG